MPSSSIQYGLCAAKASLSSTRPMSSIVRRRRGRVAGTGPFPNERVDPDDGTRLDAGDRIETVFLSVGLRS